MDKSTKTPEQEAYLAGVAAAAQQITELRAENERLRAALEQISRESGQVCADFETCSHGPCQGSLAGKLIALEALARDKCR